MLFSFACLNVLTVIENVLVGVTWSYNNYVVFRMAELFMLACMYNLIILFVMVWLYNTCQSGLSHEKPRKHNI